MNRRKLGKTNLLISEIGFGGIPIQRTTKEEVKELISFAYQKGINFIDTARSYTVSEEYIGYALRGIRDNFIIATKSMSRTYEQMKKDINISLANLETDYIDLYQLHNLTTKEDYEIVMGPNGAYKALLEAKAQGKIGYIGMTSHSFDFVSSIIDFYPFQTLQFPYNIIEDKATNLFKKASRKGVGIITMKPLAGGAIDNASIALKFILNNNAVSVAIPGMYKKEQIEENASVIKGDYEYDEIQYIKSIKEVLGNDFCRRCGYCMPCPHGLDIPSCFLLEGYYTRYDLKDWAVSRYEKLNKKASDCIKCLECVSKCPYQLNIPEKLEKVVKVFGK